MTPESIIELFQQAMMLVVIMVSVIIVPGLLIGLIVAMFQAATQINEMTLSFIPRLIITLLAMMFAAPWLLQMMMEYTTRLVNNIPYLIG